MWNSCAVSSSVVSTLRLTALSPTHDEFPPGSFGERRNSHRGQHVVSGAQVFPGLDPLTGASQPLPVQEVTPGHLQAKARSVQVLDRLAE